MDGDHGHIEMTSALPQNDSSLKISLANAGPTGEISLVRVDGVVDTVTAGELEMVITSLVGRGRYRLILDLAGVDYISSAGWGVFVSHLRDIREHDGDIKLARMTPDVREIYELLEFDGLLPAYEKLAAAQQDFYQNAAPTTNPETKVEAADQAPTAAIPPAVERNTPPAKVHPGVTLGETIQQLLADDPFYTIAEIRDQFNQQNDQEQIGWWTVFFCLRRHRLLTRRSRFRFFRRARTGLSNR